MKRRQEKLKNNILKEAAEYKALKANRIAQMQEEEAKAIDLKNFNTNLK